MGIEGGLIRGKCPAIVASRVACHPDGMSPMSLRQESVGGKGFSGRTGTPGWMEIDSGGLLTAGWIGNGGKFPVARPRGSPQIEYLLGTIPKEWV